MTIPVGAVPACRQPVSSMVAIGRIAVAQMPLKVNFSVSASGQERTFARHAYLKNHRAPIVKTSVSPANSRLTPAENRSVK